MIAPAAINLAIAARISNGLRFRSTANSSTLKGNCCSLTYWGGVRQASIGAEMLRLQVAAPGSEVYEAIL
ncbi:MAG TPA: hypothetical protein VI260_04330 [Blastocatellia bacterium]|jgi:hypothetical protein